MEKIPAGKSTLITKMFRPCRQCAAAERKVVTIERVGERCPRASTSDMRSFLQTPDGKPLLPGRYLRRGRLGASTSASWWRRASMSSTATAPATPTTCRDFNPEKFNAKYLANNRKLLDDAQELGVYVMMSVPSPDGRGLERRPLACCPTWQNLYKRPSCRYRLVR
jgi:hypothetical protein